MADFTENELETCLKVLRKVSRNPELADNLVELKTLVAKISTKSRKERRAQTRQDKSRAVLAVKESTFLYQKISS